MDLLIIDDAPDIRLLIRVVAGRHGWDVAAEAATAATGLAAWRSHRPDLVVLDILLPDGSGMDLLRAVRAEDPRQAVLMLTTVSDEAVVLDCLKAGACGYLLKDGGTWLRELGDRLTLYRRRSSAGGEEA